MSTKAGHRYRYGAAAQIRHRFSKNWESPEVGGYWFSGDTERRFLWLHCNFAETIADETGEWFDGPLLTADQALELASVLTKWQRKMKATPEEKGAKHVTNLCVKVGTIAGELVTISMTRNSAVVDSNADAIRCWQPVRMNHVAVLVKKLRKYASDIKKNEDQQ